MENRKDKISKYLLIAGFILWQIVPYILHIVILKASKHSLSSFVYVLCEVVGLLILLGLGYISLKARGISSRKEIGYIGIYYISSILVGLAIKGPLGKIENKGIVLVVGLILIIIEILLIATAIMRGFCRVKITLGVVGLVILSLIGSIIIGIVFEIIDIVIGANIVPL